MDDIKINDIIEVTVTGIQKYGAFVLINDKYDGLIHISEISSGYVKNINDYINSGDIIMTLYTNKYINSIDNTIFKVSKDKIEEPKLIYDIIK